MGVFVRVLRGARCEEGTASCAVHFVGLGSKLNSGPAWGFVGAGTHMVVGTQVVSSPYLA